MSDKYKIRNQAKACFITMTITAWVDVFARKSQKLAMIDALNYCIKNKGLTVFAYVIMPNHVHMICRADGEEPLSDILRDLKTFTSKQIIHLIKNEVESRRKWMLEIFSFACKHLKRNQKYKVWQEGNRAKEIINSKFFYQKLEYIHNNPVKNLIVENPEDYLFSSARNYAGLDSYLDVFVVGPRPLTF